MVRPLTVDALPPPPPPQPAPSAYVYAATDERPRGPRETELCAKASTTDWLYLGSGLVLTVAAITLDNRVKWNGSSVVRQMGPASLGLTWGFTLGGGYLALPKCSMDYVPSSPPEGDVRAAWPMAVAFAALAGLTAPIIEAVEVGSPAPTWTDSERVGRVVFSSGLGVVGALVPYLLPPKTWRAALELQRIRAGTTQDGHGAFVSWGVRF